MVTQPPGAHPCGTAVTAGATRVVTQPIGAHPLGRSNFVEEGVSTQPLGAHPVRSMKEVTTRDEKISGYGFGHDEMFIVDGEGIIRVANAMASTLFGHAHEDLVGHGIEMLVPDHVRGIHRAHQIGRASCRERV